MVQIDTGLTGLRASTAELLATLDARPWSAADVAAPSLCAGWTRGHVLTHLARNADGIADTVAGALRGEIVARYPDGWDARNAAIDAGADRPFTALVAGVRDSARRLDEVLDAAAGADGWELETEQGHPVKHWLLARWKEVEIHHVDLDAGYGADRWPPVLVAALLEPELARLPERAREPLRVTLTSGSLRPELAGRTWSAGAGDAREVRGPDWGVLAWLVGRPSAAAGVLSATPELGPYA